MTATWWLFMCLKVCPLKVMEPLWGLYTPLMQLSMELLPAPLGPMMARISCSRTSKEMSVSALTPPKLSEMFFTSRMTSPIFFCIVAAFETGLASGLRVEVMRRPAQGQRFWRR